MRDPNPKLSVVVRVDELRALRQRNADLERRLRLEQQARTLAEESARRAWSMSTWTPRRRDDAKEAH